MKFFDAVSSCHVRSGVFRTGDPTKIFTEEDLQKLHPSLQDISRDQVGKVVPKVYWKNSATPLSEQVPLKYQKHDDWEEYDPRERPECSAFNEMPA
jgi:hypothetical protein